MAEPPDRRAAEAATPALPRYELRRFHVAGFRYHAGPQLIGSIGPRSRLQLVREPENEHDRRAVAIHFTGQRIGYVPRVKNRLIARLLDQGAVLHCETVEVDPQKPHWESVLARVLIVSGGERQTR